MKNKIHIFLPRWLAVFIPLWFVVLSSMAQNPTPISETTVLSVEPVVGNSYVWELYSKSEGIDFVKTTGNCTADKAYFVNNINTGASVKVKWLKPGVYFYKITVRNACTDNVKIGKITVTAVQPSAKIVAVNDAAKTIINKPVVIPILKNDELNGNSVIINIYKAPQHALPLVINPDNTILYYPEKDFEGADMFEYEICSLDHTSCSKASVSIRVEGMELKLDFYNVITPNNDGINDYLKIGGIEKYKDNVVTIFNRWGDKVKIIDMYNNSERFWDGRDEKNRHVPDGVYWYKLEVKGKQPVIKWVLVRSGNK